MKLADVKTYICNTFHQAKMKVSQKISEIHKPGKIAAVIAGTSAVITIFVFMTGKNLPDIFTFIAPTDKVQ